MKNRRKFSLLNATNDPVFKFVNYHLRVFVKRYCRMRAFFKIFALTLFSPDWTPLSGHNRSFLPQEFSPVDIRSCLSNDKKSTKTQQSKSCMEGSPRCKNKAFKGFIASQYTKHKHKNMLWGRPPSLSCLCGR